MCCSQHVIHFEHKCSNKDTKHDTTTSKPKKKKKKNQDIRSKTDLHGVSIWREKFHCILGSWWFATTALRCVKKCPAKSIALRLLFYHTQQSLIHSFQFYFSSLVVCFLWIMTVYMTASVYDVQIAYFNRMNAAQINEQNENSHQIPWMQRSKQHCCNCYCGWWKLSWLR